jgi:4-carboxymuconolactone decarboxylase
MAEDEELVYDTLTELINSKGLSDPTYARAVAKFGEQGLVDLISIVGYYTMLAMVMNVARTGVGDGKPLPLPALPLRALPL